MKVGQNSTKINITLNGGEQGDERDFVWTVKSYASDGSDKDVITLETTNGNVYATRTLINNSSFGDAYVTPVNEGTAVISISHPKILYPTEILVKVLSQDAIIEEPLFFKGEGLIRILNGEKQNYTVTLSGKSKTPADEQDIKWTIDDNRYVVTGNENTAEITAPANGSGTTIAHLNIGHPKVESEKSVLILTADDIETLMSIKALYADKNYYNFEVGDSVALSLSTVGFEDDYDFSMISWEIENPDIIELDTNEYNPLSINVTGLKSGRTKLKAIVENYSFTYTLTVYPVGAVQLEPEIYFTTSNNVIILNEPNASATAKITAINMKPANYSQINWDCSNNEICDVKPNGLAAVITAKKEGEAIITVSHQDSQNSIKLYIKVGSKYIIQDSNTVYISASTDVVTLIKGEQAQKVQALLVNYSGNDSEHFDFEVDNPAVASIASKSANGICYISPINAGQTELTISNSHSELTKKVLVVVGNTPEELTGITYMTTTNNVISIGEGKYKNVSVSVVNSAEPVITGFSWFSNDPSIADVTGNGNTASIKANSQGTTYITVQNPACKYKLQMIVHVVDPITAAAHPYVQLSSSVLVLTVNDSFKSLTADLVGGNESDWANFVWESNDPSICSVFGQNEVGKIKALKAGTTYITVSHPKADYSAQLLVVCENSTKSECYISVPSSILNMKPTDAATTITASLVNGTSNDKYNFKWSLDVFDIIDFQYSANVCTIKPKQAGTVTINISHPKADYDQQIIVTVSEYTTFAFPDTNITITQGDVKFVSMQVPTTNVKTHIEYYVKNDKICSISGTNQVAQITGIGKGTTTVNAKLIASNTGIEQASADMMIYVSERATTDAYIT